MAPPIFDGDGLLPLRDAELAFRKQHFRRALAMTDGNQTKAAALVLSGQIDVWGGGFGRAGILDIIARLKSPYKALLDRHKR